MLFIFYGATLEAGYQIRKIMKRNHFSIIKKYNYVKDDADVIKKMYEDPTSDKYYARWYDDKVYADSAAEIEKCDFHYGLNGVMTGFNKEQILDAVWGKSDAAMTTGSSTLDFAIELNKAYDDSVTMVYVYSDQKRVAGDYELSKSISRKEKKTRVEANKKMQEIYLKNIAEFDDVVIYNGDDTAFDLKSLSKQLKTIIERSREREKTLLDLKYVKMPYTGNDPYLFISYSHHNFDRVENQLILMQRSSYRIWYDDAIKGGENWRIIVADRIEKCEQFVLFLSKESAGSSFVNDEIRLAITLNKKILIINVDQSQLPAEFKMTLANSKQLSINDRSLKRKLLEALDEKTHID